MEHEDLQAGVGRGPGSSMGWAGSSFEVLDGLGWVGLGWVGLGYGVHVRCRQTDLLHTSQLGTRNFSSAGHTVTDVRSRLSAGKVDSSELVRWVLRAGLLTDM